MNTIKVVNIKCGGCQRGIIDALEKKGFKNIGVNIESQEVSFEGDAGEAKNILNKMGYPEASSEEAKSILKKGQSYVSCAIGKMK